MDANDVPVIICEIMEFVDRLPEDLAERNVILHDKRLFVTQTPPHSFCLSVNSDFEINFVEKGLEWFVIHEDGAGGVVHEFKVTDRLLIADLDEIYDFLNHLPRNNAAQQVREHLRGKSEV